MTEPTKPVIKRGGGGIFDDVPKEHPYLKLDQPVRVLDKRSLFYGMVGTIDNIRLGDRSCVYVGFSDQDIRKARAGVPAHRLGTNADIGRSGYTAYYPPLDLVPLEDELEQLIGDWTYTARFRRNASGGYEKIIVTGPLIREGDAVLDLPTKDTPGDALKGSIIKAFVELVAPQLITRLTSVEDLVGKLAEGKLSL